MLPSTEMHLKEAAAGTAIAGTPGRAVLLVPADPFSALEGLMPPTSAVPASSAHVKDDGKLINSHAASFKADVPSMPAVPAKAEPLPNVMAMKGLKPMAPRGNAAVETAHSSKDPFAGLF
jgi:hypothetical protein